MNNILPFNTLQRDYHRKHKNEIVDGTFGCDTSGELIDECFGIYSSVGLKEYIPPARSNFFRIAVCFHGTVEVTIGTKLYRHERGTAHFCPVGEVFSLQNKHDDLKCIYMLILPTFLTDDKPLFLLEQQFPFLTTQGDNFFRLSEEDLSTITLMTQLINNEVQGNDPLRASAIRHYTNLMLITFNRAYQKLRHPHSVALNIRNDISLLASIRDLILKQKVVKRDLRKYADLLNVSPRVLARAIKDSTGKSPAEFFNEILEAEAKRLLIFTSLTIAEIAADLQFFDASHFIKYFKRRSGKSPQQYRNDNLMKQGNWLP